MDLTQKYLFYDIKNHSGGLDDHLRALANVILVSYSLGRIPVITQFHNDTAHNFDAPPKLVQFQDYVDLSKTCIFKINVDETVEQVASSMQWISASNFDIHSFSKEQIAHIHLSQGECKDGNIVEEETDVTNIFDEKLNQYKLIYAQTKPYFGVKGVYASKPTFLRWAYQVLQKSQAIWLREKGCLYFALLQPSQTVENLTDVVLNHFGMSRIEMASLKKHLTLQYRGTQNKNFIFFRRTRCFYACLHLRTKHTSYYNVAYYFSSLRRQIKKVVREARLPHGTKLYIMSDLHNPGYFDFLRSDYQVYTYHDFPELKQLVSGEDDSADNYMLYSVEKNIMSHAVIQIVPPESNFSIFPLHASYHVPYWLRLWHKVYRSYFRFKIYKDRLTVGK